MKRKLKSDLPIADTIKQIRRVEREISLAELSRRSGLSRPYLSRLEAGQADNPTVETLGLIAEALGVPMITLLREDTGPEGSVSAHVLPRAAQFVRDALLDDLLWHVDKSLLEAEIISFTRGLLAGAAVARRAGALIADYGPMPEALRGTAAKIGKAIGLRQFGQTAAASEILKDCIDQLEASGVSGPLLAKAFVALGDVELFERRPKEAWALFTQARDLMDRALVNGDLEEEFRRRCQIHKAESLWARAKANLAGDEPDKAERAEAEIQSARAIIEHIEAAGASDISTSLAEGICAQVLGRIYEEKGDPERAFYWYNQSLQHDTSLHVKARTSAYLCSLCQRVTRYRSELERYCELAERIADRPLGFRTSAPASKFYHILARIYATRARSSAEHDKHGDAAAWYVAALDAADNFESDWLLMETLEEAEHFVTDTRKTKRAIAGSLRDLEKKMTSYHEVTTRTTESGHAGEEL